MAGFLKGSLEGQLQGAVAWNTEGRVWNAAPDLEIPNTLVIPFQFSLSDEGVCLWLGVSKTCLSPVITCY